MTREEAIEIIKNRFDKWALDDRDLEAIKSLIPELVENEDERIRKQLVDIVAFIPEANFKSASREDCRAYLEKQKDANKEYWRGYREGKQEILDKYAEIEKQKEQNPTEDKSHIDWSYLEERPCSKEDEYESVENGNATGWRRKQKTPHFNTYEEFCEYYKDYHVCSRELFEMGARNVGTPKMKPQSEIPSTQWSEEDEKIRQSIIKDIEFERNYALATTDKANKVIEKYNEQIAWLKSPRPSWKPSKNDQTLINTITERILEEGPIPTLKGKEKADFEKEFNRFKQICGFVNWSAREEIYKRVVLWFICWSKDHFPELGREQGDRDNHWKPSKEQMDALKESSASWMSDEMGNCELLKSLYNDLQKL